MKYLLSIGLVLFMVIQTFGQSHQSLKKIPLPLAVFNDNVSNPLSIQERNFILEAYGDYAEAYVFSNPNKLKSIKQLLRNRIIIKRKASFEKYKGATKLSELSLFTTYVPDLKRDSYFDPKSFNPLKYNMQFHGTSAQVYDVDGTDYVILLKSQYQ
jgi:hypothetical protein